MTDEGLFAPWLQPGYADITSARRVGDEIEVLFENGDVLRVGPDRFGLVGDFAVEVVDGGDVVRVATAEDSRHLSWSQLRMATDPDFAQEMRRQDAEEARRLGLRLRALREDRNLSQRDLANMVGMPAPQLSKIESGAFDLRVSTVQTLLRAMNASFADVGGPHALEVSQKTLRRRGTQAGVPREVLDRLLSIAARSDVPRMLARAFGWPIRELATGELATPSVPVAVNFKAKNVEDATESPLLHAAYVCSQLVTAHSRRPNYRHTPRTARAARELASDQSGRVTLQSLAVWIWDQGVPVIPLLGRGAFYAATWTVDATPVIVLKDTRVAAPFWLFELAHEWGHIERGHVTDRAIVDVDAPQPFGQQSVAVDAQEAEATEYALELLLGDHDEVLASVRNETRGNYLRFKGAVATVANRYNLSPGLLGMIAAYELTEVGEYKDRWGSATNLARDDGNGRAVVQAELYERLDLAACAQADVLLLTALTTADADR